MPEPDEIERIDIFAEAEAALQRSRLSGGRKDEASALLLTAELQLSCEDHEAALESAEGARKIFSELRNDGREAEAIRLAVKARLASGNLKEASVQEKRERETFEKAGKRRAATVMLLSYSDTQLAARNPRKALKAATTAVTVFKQLRDVRWQVLALHQVGEVQKEFNGAAEMLDVVKQAGPLLSELGEEKEEALIMEIKSHAYQVMGDPARAMEATEAGLCLSRRANDPIGEGAALNNIANAYLMVPESAADALAAAREAFVHCVATENKREAAFALQGMVHAYCILERFDDAIRAQKKLLSLARERKDKRQVEQAQQGLATLEAL